MKYCLIEILESELTYKVKYAEELSKLDSPQFRVVEFMDNSTPADILDVGTCRSYKNYMLVEPREMGVTCECVNLVLDGITDQFGCLVNQKG